MAVACQKLDRDELDLFVSESSKRSASSNDRFAATRAPAANESIESHEKYIHALVARGGPRPTEDVEFDSWLVGIDASIRTGAIGDTELARLRSAFGVALSAGTMQGFALTKPHGYAGDFEIIDNIYRYRTSADPRLACWDRYFHDHAAAKAVRNRKTYLHQLLDRHSAHREQCRVLKIASGPGRSMFEWLTAHPAAPISFECVEVDANAIRFAAALNHRFLDRITFVEKNALRYRPDGQFDLVWAAGIFDYFNDKVFVSLLARLIGAVAPGGELVIGNFSDRNPSRPYMEVLNGWRLFHRSADHLRALARECGAPEERVTIGSEPEGVNLFLHIRG